MTVCFVRPPHNSGYNTLDVREDAIVTYAIGYFEGIGFTDYKIYDFHLVPETTLSEVVTSDSDVFIVVVRETGAAVHYALKIARQIFDSGKKTLLYGQVGRLHAIPNIPSGIDKVIHDERALAAALGLNQNGPTFDGCLVAKPYIHGLIDRIDQSRVNRLRGSLESSRGCHFKCKFCFINHGVNYPQQWNVRPLDRILEDIGTYSDLGINSIVFHDSEFIGPTKQNHQRVRLILSSIRNMYPSCRAMIFARADTIALIENFGSMAKDVVSNVFIGVESLCDADLKALGKSTSSKILVDTIIELKTNGIMVELNFMLFNRSTTIESLEQNVVALRKISFNDKHLLGVPKFLGSFESIWDSTRTYELSENSYIPHLNSFRQQANSTLNVSFQPALEPIAEICRLAFYEIACKVTELNYGRDSASKSTIFAIDNWFEALWPFSISILEVCVRDYKNELLCSKNYQITSTTILEKFERLYRLLPEKHRSVSTFEHWNRTIELKGLQKEDHGWDHKTTIRQPVI